MGRLVIMSIQNRDYPVVQATLMLVVFVFLLTNIVVDLSYAVLDPRIRLTGRAQG
jgi:ABC-type dipeptide/oligopeptide/nickel transport system permease component